jgi:hypothetical protein
VRVGPAEGQPECLVQLLERLILAHRDHADDFAPARLVEHRRRLGQHRLERQGLHDARS